MYVYIYIFIQERNKQHSFFDDVSPNGFFKVNFHIISYKLNRNIVINYIKKMFYSPKEILLLQTMLKFLLLVTYNLNLLDMKSLMFQSSNFLFVLYRLDHSDLLFAHSCPLSNHYDSQ